MTPTDLLFWLVLGSVGSGVGAALLARYLCRHRGKPGANWFILTLVGVAVFCLSYGVSLLVFDPSLRAGFELVTIASVCFVGPFFLAFGLEYTGRGDVVRSWIFAPVAAVPLITVPVAATNTTHGLLWTGFRLDPIFGAATVEYTLQPWGLFAILFTLVASGVGVLLLAEAILSYGPLYRTEGVAVITSTLFPTVGALMWIFGVGPAPQLNLAPILFVPHLFIDAYAFVGTHMFDTNPTTQRAAERSALEGLNDPLLVIDPDEQVVNLNDRAKGLFEVDTVTELPIPLERLTGVGLEELHTAGEISSVGADRRTYAISYTPLSDPRGDDVGGMVALYDVTEERRRKQQLSVLNRIIRHNLRNEMTIIRGHAEMIGEAVDDPGLAAQAEAIGESGGELLAIAEKVRDFERIQDRKLHPTDVSVPTVLDDIESEFNGETRAVECTVETSGLRVRTDVDLLSLILSNLVGNAIEHAENDPSVTVRATGSAGDGGAIRFEVRDRNKQIPDIEIRTLSAREETPLQHGQGIGLWIVHWCVTVLDGTVEFDYDDGNVVTVTLPDL